MGNNQTTLSGIHPFRDPNDPTQPTQEEPGYAASSSATAILPAQPPNKLIGFNPVIPQVTVDEPTNGNNKPYSEFDELFVVKPPTPPPRRVSAGDMQQGKRRTLKGLFSTRNLSLRNLRLSRPDLNKLGTLLRWKRGVKKRVDVVYPVPPDAEKPSPPSKPEVVQEEDYFLLRWDRPGYDGGLPIIGYIIQHLELGLPQTDPEIEKDDTQSWYSSEPGQVTSTEVMLNNLIPGTTYIFRIIAENLLGYSQPGETSIPIVFNPHGELDDWFCPPVFVIPLDESYTVLEHERVCLSVEITGQPYPLVKFYRDDVELRRELDPIKYTTTSCGQKRSLVINSVEVKDSGVVRVVGENEKGVVECTGVLVVEAPPRIRRIHRLDLESELTEEDQKLLSQDDGGVIFQSGELAKFKFIWSASPYPNICVYHEGDLVWGNEPGSQVGRVTSQRVGVEVLDNVLVVKIPNVQRNDRGEWTTRLDNVLGEDAASVILTVTDKPSRPGKPDVLQLSDNTVILKWSEPYDSGGFPIHAYTVEYFRSEWGVWLKATTVKNPYTKIRDLIPGSKYKFRVKAENLYGVSDVSDESVELLITDLVSTLRSVVGEKDDDATATLLMKTVVEEEEEAVTLEEDASTRPTPPKRKLLSEDSSKVSSSTMTEVTTLGQAEAPQLSSPQPSPKLLRVSLQPQVIVLEEEPDSLQPPEIQPRLRSQSPLPRSSRSSIIFEESEPNSREKSPETVPVAPARSKTITSIKTQENEMGQVSVLPQLNNAPVQPVIVQPISESSKKIYSRAEIIRSAATEDLDYYLNLSSTTTNEPEEEDQHEELEEDPELLKVKEKLMNDELEDEDEEESYEYDFDQLQQEYDEDKKRGMVSRQDSGVSGRSVTSRGASFNTEDEEVEDKPRNYQSEEVVAKLVADEDRLFRRGSFERAQSEVAVRSRGPGAFLHDRFTDYIAMKAASKNQRVGSSLRSLNSGSRYSSSDNLQPNQQQPPTRDTPSKDSGRSSMHQEPTQQQLSGEPPPPTPPPPPPQTSSSRSFRFRSFDPETEKTELEKLERSVSRVSFRGTYDVVRSVQAGDGDTTRITIRGGVSAPDLGNDDQALFKRRSFQLEKSRSEQFDDVVIIDSGLQARGLVEGAFMPGGVDSITSGGEEYGEDGSLEIDLSLERDCPRERDSFGRHDSQVEFEGEELEDDEGGHYDILEEQTQFPPVGLTAEDLKFKVLESMGEYTVPEKNEQLDSLLSKLDKFLEEEDEGEYEAGENIEVDLGQPGTEFIEDELLVPMGSETAVDEKLAEKSEHEVEQIDQLEEPKIELESGDIQVDQNEGMDLELDTQENIAREENQERDQEIILENTEQLPAETPYDGGVQFQNEQNEATELESDKEMEKNELVGVDPVPGESNEFEHDDACKDEQDEGETVTEQDPAVAEESIVEGELDILVDPVSQLEAATSEQGGQLEPQAIEEIPQESTVEEYISSNELTSDPPVIDIPRFQEEFDEDAMLKEFELQLAEILKDTEVTPDLLAPDQESEPPVEISAAPEISNIPQEKVVMSVMKESEVIEDSVVHEVLQLEFSGGKYPRPTSCCMETGAVEVGQYEPPEIAIAPPRRARSPYHETAPRIDDMESEEPEIAIAPPRRARSPYLQEQYLPQVDITESEEPETAIAPPRRARSPYHETAPRIDDMESEIPETAIAPPRRPRSPYLQEQITPQVDITESEEPETAIAPPRRARSPYLQEQITPQVDITESEEPETAIAPPRRARSPYLQEQITPQVDIMESEIPETAIAPPRRPRSPYQETPPRIDIMESEVPKPAIAPPRRSLYHQTNPMEIIPPENTTFPPPRRPRSPFMPQPPLPHGPKPIQPHPTNEPQKPIQTKKDVDSPKIQQTQKLSLSLIQAQAKQRVPQTPQLHTTSTDVMTLSPVEEDPRVNTPVTRSQRSYAPDMNAYDLLLRRKRTNSNATLSRTPSSSSQQLLRAYSPTPSVDSQPVPLSEIQRKLHESTKQLIHDLVQDAPPPESILPPPPPQPQSQVTPFMNYVFHLAFYLMLSPVLLFVDDLTLGFICIFLIAFVHYCFMH